MVKQTRNIQVIKDLDGKNIVIINDIIFKGKRHIDWKDVEKYLRKYVGEFYEVAETKDIVYIGKDLPDEYTRSTNRLNTFGTRSKAKANLVQAIPEVIEIATNKRFKENLKDKHSIDAKNGWYRYDTRFGLPIYDDKGGIERYNIFKATLVIRSSINGKLYLYDIKDIAKENELNI